MPVLEAMASGCPVITTHHGSLREVADEAALVVSGHDQQEMIDALKRVQVPEERQSLIARGLKQSTKFRWEDAAKQFHVLLLRAEAEREDKDVIEFHRRWKQIRTAQADVDVGVD